MPNARPLSVATVSLEDDGDLGNLQEAVMNLPVDPGNGVAVLVHKIEGWLEPPDTPDPSTTIVTDRNISRIALSTKQGLSAFPAREDAGSIYRLDTVMNGKNETTGSGGLCSTIVGQYHSLFPGGLLVADKKLSAYVLQDGELDGGVEGTIRVYYELVQVSREDFFAALSIFNEE